MPKTPLTETTAAVSSTRSTQSYGCTERGFRCVDQVECVDERTPSEREENAASKKRKMEKWKTAKLVGGLLGCAFC
jgi:hypothetical protein